MGDLDSESGMEALAIIDNMYKWTETFYDMKVEDVKETIHLNSKNRIVYIEYHYKQLGKDEKWFNDMCSVLNGDKLKIKRELLLQRKNFMRCVYGDIYYEISLIAGNS